MVLENRVEDLRSLAEKAERSLDSVSELLRLTKEISNGIGNLQDLKKAQKQVLLDSFSVKKFHRDYKEWENNGINLFIDGEVKAYNRKLAQMSRLHNEIFEQEEKYAELRKTISLPQFQFSLQTIESYEGGRLLERLETENGKYPRKIQLDQLFSLDSNSRLPPPSFTEFNQLVNLEYRLRMFMQIKHEVLLRVKTHLTAKNTQWATRDAALDLFMTRDLPKVIAEVEKIKTSEYEDLKYYEEEYEMEDDEEEEEEEEVEEEEEEAEEENDDVREENRDEEEVPENGRQSKESSGTPEEIQDTPMENQDEIAHDETTDEVAENFQEHEPQEAVEPAAAAADENSTATPHPVDQMILD